MMRKLSASNTVLLILCLMYLILYVDRVNISTAAPLIKADLGLSNTELGLAFSAFAYPYALFQLIGGYFGDKFGARLTLMVSALIVCAATAATGAVGGARQPVRSATCPRHRRGRDISDRDARHGGVDAGAPLGLCPGHHPFVRADRAQPARRSEAE
jgi:MFS family permease